MPAESMQLELHIRRGLIKIYLIHQWLLGQDVQRMFSFERLFSEMLYIFAQRPRGYILYYCKTYQNCNKCSSVACAMILCGFVVSGGCVNSLLNLTILTATSIIVNKQTAFLKHNLLTMPGRNNRRIHKMYGYCHRIQRLIY